jgi:hypothetical protein
MKIYLFISLSLFCFIGCDLLTTRDAQPPGNPRSNYQSPVTPEILIDNLINSFKDKNVENYTASFSDTSFTSKRFVFVPSSGAAAQFPSLSSDWNLFDEEQYFRNMISKVSDDLPITLIFSNTEYSPQGDSLIFGSSYSINVPHGQLDLPTDYQGELRFTMIRDSRSIWSISFWQDNKSSNLPSWSELKGRFY